MTNLQSETAGPVAPKPGLFRRNLVGWYLYDCGQSAFATSVVTVFFGPFITAMARAAAGGADHFSFFGIALHPGAYYPYLISASVVLQVLILPFAGALADHRGRKKEMLGVAAVTGAAAVCGLFFVGGEHAVSMAGGLFVVANLAFGIADVLYGALLIDVSATKERDAVSSTGWGLGYLVSGLLLVAQYLLLSGTFSLPVSEDVAVRLCLFSSGAWWIFCTVLFLRIVRVAPRRSAPRSQPNPFRVAVSQLVSTARNARRYPQALMFLLAYLVYSDGIQTVTSVSTQFGQEELGMSVQSLAQVILIVQFVGFAGAFLFLGIARVLGTKNTIMLTLVVFAGITVYTYGWVTTPTQFYIMAAVVALVLVSSQALSRSLYSQMVPDGHEAAYFGLFEISERGTSWSGPLVFGMALQYSNSYRIAVLALGVFFIIGMILLGRVNVPRAVAAREAGRQEPAPQPV